MTPPNRDASDAGAADRLAQARTARAETHWARRLYLRWILPRIGDPRVRQRFKLAWFAWGYWPLLFLNGLPLATRLRLLRDFLRIDWNVLHCHFPSETVRIARSLAERPARPDEVVVEAGCWQGGSSAKFSLLCRELGYRLHVYDSFEGVETLSAEEQAQEWDFAGQYASPEARLREHLERFGAPEVCEIHKGWFSDTLASAPVAHPVRLAYIDCDLAKGTREVLQGVLPSLTPDGWIYTQDFHIDPVRRLLLDPETWSRLGASVPELRQEGVFLASMRFEGGPFSGSADRPIPSPGDRRESTG